MADWELTQAGINSILDASSSGVRSQVNYINAYLVDGSFSSTDFKALTTVADQKQYLEDHSQNGYSQPPFANNTDDRPLNRETGGDLANRPAITVNVNNVNRMTYLYELPVGYGDYYFNLIVSYNSEGLADPDTNETMPIFGFYKFDAIQSKLQTNAIELYGTYVYNGISSAVEFEITNTSAASVLEVSSPDLLLTPSSSSSNTYLIHNVDNTQPYGNTPSGSSYLAYIKNNQWRFAAYENVIVSGSVGSGATPTTTSINYVIDDKKIIDYAEEASGRYLIQFTSGEHSGLVRQIKLNKGFNSIVWNTSLGTAPSVGDTFDIYEANETFYLRTPRTVELTGQDSIISAYGGTYWYSSTTTSHAATLSAEQGALPSADSKTTLTCSYDSDFNLNIELSGVTAVWSFDTTVSIAGYSIKPGEIIELVKTGENSFVAYAPNGISDVVELGGDFDAGAKLFLTRTGRSVDIVTEGVVSHVLNSTPDSASNAVPALYRTNNSIQSNIYRFASVDNIIAMASVTAAGSFSISYYNVSTGGLEDQTDSIIPASISYPIL